MTPGRLERAAAILEQAVGLSGAALEEHLNEACGSDSALRQEVESLLAFRAQQGDFLASPEDALEVTKVVKTPAPWSDSALNVEAEGSVIGNYKILQLIGEGGFGEVYMAEQERPVRRRVALKIIKLGMDTKQVIGRFEAERQALAMMDHPCISRVLDAGATGSGRPYFAMELVRGESITDYCDKNNVSVPERLKLFQQVCSAVQHAHQKGIIHRDIKPSNVMVTLHDGVPTPKVIDFGIAKATNARLTERTVFTELQQMIGTPEYMSPEQAEQSGLDIDTRTDIYSLGVLLYELLTGVKPFDIKKLRSAAYNEVQRYIREETPARPSSRISTLDTLPSVAAQRHTEPRKLSLLVRGDLDWIVMKALEKDRTRRYETASGFAADIARHLANEPVQASPPSRAYRLLKLVRRNRGTFAAASVFTLILLAGVIGTSLGLMSSIRANDALDQSLKREEQQRILAENNERAAVAARESAELSRDETEAVVEFLADMLAAADPAEQGREVKVREVLDRASRRVGTEFADRPLVEARLRHTMADTYRALGLLEEAEDQILRARRLREREQGSHSPQTLESAVVHAAIRGGQGHYVEAEKLLAEAIRHQSRILGAQHEDTLDSLSVRADVLIELGRWQEAESQLQAIHGSQVESLGVTHRKTLQSQFKLALVESRQSHFARAEQRFRTVLSQQRSTLGSEHPDTIATVHQLGNLLLGEERYVEAEPLLRESVQLRERVLGEEHPATLAARCDLANAWSGLRRHREAQAELEEVLEIRQRVSGPEHPETLMLMALLGLMHRNSGDLESALPLLASAIAAQRNTLGFEHPRTVITLIQTAEAYQRKSRLDEALSLSREAYALANRVLGPDHRWTLKAMWTLGSCYRKLGRFDEAEPVLQELLERRRRVFGEDEPATIHAYGNLALLKRDQNRLAEAEALFRTTATKFLKVVGPNDTRPYEHLRALAVLLLDQGRYDEARLIYAEVVEGMQRVHGPEHRETMTTLSGLGQLEHLQGNNQEALEIWTRVFAIRERDLGPFHISTAGVLVRLTNLHVKLGQPEKARELLRTLLEHEPKTAAEENEVAWLLISCVPEDMRDPKAALKLARACNERTQYKNPHYLDTLAAALHHMGDHSTAIVYQRKAVKLTPARERQRFGERLEQYEEAFASQSKQRK